MNTALPLPTGPILSVRNLTKRFGGLTALNDLSFEVRSDEILGLIGPNGAGKSTTFDLISGFRRPTAGTLHFRGRNMAGLDASAVSRLGLVRTFQHASFFREMTVVDNIALSVLNTPGGPATRRRHAAAAIELLELGDVVGEMAEVLPHGRQRMLSIAIALGASPQLLCLDEPLTGLNSTEVRVALKAIEAVRQEYRTAVLLVDHNMRAMMQVCERFVVLNHGSFLAEGTPEQIKAHPEVIDAYLGTES